MFPAYVAASAEWHSFVSSMISEGKNFGFPEGTIVGQMARILSKWLKNNPEKLHLAGRDCFIYAMKDAFPNSKQ